MHHTNLSRDTFPTDRCRLSVVRPRLSSLPMQLRDLHAEPNAQSHSMPCSGLAMRRYYHGIPPPEPDLVAYTG